MILLILLLLTSVSFSATVIEPVKSEVSQGSNIYVGDVGPGQPFSVSILKRVYEGGRFGKGGYFDRAVVSNLPEGWSAKDSKIFDDPLQVRIVPAEDAEEGNYTFTITLVDVDNAELLGNLSFNVTVSINKDVMAVYVDRKVFRSGPSQPFRVVVNVWNKANIGDVFVAKANIGGIVKEKEVFIPAKKYGTVVFEFTLKDEDVYRGTLEVRSKHSASIRAEESFTAYIEGSFFEDIGASGRGVLLLYYPFQPIYDIAYLLYSAFS